MELRFLISTFVPKVSTPIGRMEILTSQRSDPSSILPVDTLRNETIWRIASTKAAACAPLRISGRVTISIKGMPARL